MGTKTMKTNRNRIPICLLCVLLLQALTSGAQPVTTISAGYSHSLFIKNGGSLWTMGDDEDGQLGNGIYNDFPTRGWPPNLPGQIVASNVTVIAGGGRHSLFLKSNGSLWTMGDNNHGQLGDGTYNITNQPEEIVASNVTTIAAGLYHSLFLKNDGSLWAMGWNINGQLGDGTYNNTNRPEQIVTSNVIAIAAGDYHSLFIKCDGSLWVMGSNYYGQLGDGTYNNTNRPEQIVASNVTVIAAGGVHSLFIKSDGSLWAMGSNGYGELGDGTTDSGNYSTNIPEQIVTSNVIAVAAGEAHSLFIKSDGSLWVMGYNYDGELGDGTYNNTNQPEQIVTGGVTAIAAGVWYSLFLKSDGSLWGMGHNSYGELGNYGGTPPGQILAPYNQISGQLMGGTNMQLNFVGIANANYALDRASSLSPPNWIPQATNPASSFGPLVFTNPPDATTNNFWRIRSVP
jgi:alpha-tubulin suppressor-like RCC1 family protein